MLNIGVRFFEFIEEQDGCGRRRTTSVNRLLAITNIPGRADELRDRMAL